TIEAAYHKPAGETPIWYDGNQAPASANFTPANTPDFSNQQGYLEAAPGGINARFAWTKPGGRGAGIRIIDLEWGWNFAHEDLLQNQGGIVDGAGFADTDHGTCVIGVISADHNPIGVLGIAPDANISAVSFSLPTATAIRKAADRLQAGDIMLLEIHRPGPRHNFQGRNDQAGYIAVEWWPDDFAAILYATSKGIIVCEAAGNGSENLDDNIYNIRPANFQANWKNPFDRNNPQCGAILCGAGAPPPGTHGQNHGPDRSRLSFSNFGACVDAQGWGREVTTTGRSWGVADLHNGGPNAWYTDHFSGTSSASPVVTGALACAQGWLRAANKPLLTPAKARTLLRTTGSPQQDAPGRPVQERIGNRPDLKALHAQLFPAKPLIKEKDIKDIKDKNLKEKSEKKEVKEIKEKDFKENKEKDFKEIKEKDVKDVKEFLEKDRKEKDKEKDIRENIGMDDHINIRSMPVSMEARLNSLETQLGQIMHFIDSSLRPDLSQSPLSQEAQNKEDLQALSDALAKQAQDAKNAKDVKDSENFSR
ncbi:MAG: S8 family serine peptidase, partial [Magnetococcus sp. YQC-5]